jgi:t-SNARE complex subunit (syntaxin)
VTAAAFDTDRSIDSLTASGMPEAQAQALTALLKQFRDMELSTLATKSDVAETRADLLHDIVDTRADLGQAKADLLRGLAEARAEILKWVIGMIGGAVVVNIVTVIGAMLVFVRFVGR